MAQVTLRLDDELLAKVDTQEGSSRQEKVLAALERGVSIPDGLEALMLSKAQITCLDQLADRAGLSRIELLARYVGERLNREFVEDRQRQMGNLKLAKG